jgi:hypothetical protein
MASDSEDYEYYEYSDNGEEEGQSDADGNGMEWSSENPNAAPMTFKGESQRWYILTRSYFLPRPNSCDDSPCLRKVWY